MPSTNGEAPYISGLNSTGVDQWGRAHETGHAISDILRYDGATYKRYYNPNNGYIYTSPEHDATLSLEKLTDEMFADGIASKAYRPDYLGENNIYLNRYNWATKNKSYTILDTNDHSAGNYYRNMGALWRRVPAKEIVEPGVVHITRKNREGVPLHSTTIVQSPPKSTD